MSIVHLSSIYLKQFNSQKKRILEVGASKTLTTAYFADNSCMKPTTTTSKPITTLTRLKTYFKGIKGLSCAEIGLILFFVVSCPLRTLKQVKA